MDAERLEEAPQGGDDEPLPMDAERLEEAPQGSDNEPAPMGAVEEALQEIQQEPQETNQESLHVEVTQEELEDCLLSGPSFDSRALSEHLRDSDSSTN